MPTGLSPEDTERFRPALARSVIYFPLVGGMVASVTAIAITGLLQILSGELAVVLAIAFEAMLTGALHEDALADTCDALGGGWTRERVLEILKDSRLGTYGTLGLGLGLACRFFSLVALADDQWRWLGAASLIAAGALGRWGMLWFMQTVKPIEDRKTMASDVAGSNSRFVLLVSALIGSPAVCPWLWLDPIGGAIAIGLSAIVLAIFRWKALQRVGGSTGDFIGCSGYLVQLTVLVVAAARVRAL